MPRVSKTEKARRLAAYMAFVGPPTLFEFCGRWHYSPPTKKCSACGQIKNRSTDFYKIRGTAAPRCKVCDCTRTVERRKKDPAKRRAHESIPEVRARRKETARAYRQREYVKAKKAAYEKQPAVLARARVRADGFEATPELVAARMEYTANVRLIQEIQHVIKHL